MWLAFLKRQKAKRPCEPGYRFATAGNYSGQENHWPCKLTLEATHDRCATNQVLYNVGSRGIEYDLLPWCEQRGMPVMAYTPLGGNHLVHDPTLAEIGAAHGCSAAAVALAWAIRSGNVIAIPESGSAAHVKENAIALSLALTPQELQTLEAAHPPPTAKVPLDRPVL